MKETRNALVHDFLLLVKNFL